LGLSRLFGAQAAAAYAVYPHRHDHVHDPAGEVVPLETDGRPS